MMMKQLRHFFVHIMQLLGLGGVALFPILAHSANLTVTFSPKPYNSITLRGTVTASDVSISSFGGTGDSFIIDFRTDSPSFNYTYQRGNFCAGRTASAVASSINSLLATGIVLPRYGSGSYVEGATYNFTSLWFHGSCPGISFSIQLRTPPTPINPPPVPNPPSVCSLNNQNLTYSYSSSSLNVNGLSQNRTAAISCTAGTAQNYRLSLTSTNTTNGRLNFGNGVSAQISLNGTQVSANGTGISLNGLTSQTLSVNSTLVGTASGSGTTNANGVLVLEAL